MIRKMHTSGTKYLARGFQISLQTTGKEICVRMPERLFVMLAQMAMFDLYHPC